MSYQAIHLSIYSAKGTNAIPEFQGKLIRAVSFMCNQLGRWFFFTDFFLKKLHSVSFKLYISTEER